MARGGIEVFVLIRIIARGFILGLSEVSLTRFLLLFISFHMAERVNFVGIYWLPGVRKFTAAQIPPLLFAVLIFIPDAGGIESVRRILVFANKNKGLLARYRNFSCEKERRFYF